MAAYVEQHDVRGLMDELAQSVLLRMPQDPRSFLAAELARHRPLPTDNRDAGALPRDVFVLRLHAAVDRGSGGPGTTVSFRRVLSRLPRGRMARLQAERDVAEQVRVLLWESGDTAEHGAEAAEGGGHNQQRIKELEELLAEAKRQVRQDQASASLTHQEPAILHGLMLALAKLDDAALRREFDAHADLAADTFNEGGWRMSKDGLAKLMHAKGLAHGDSEVGRIMERMDANGDGEIDFGEFRALSRANSDLEQVLRAKRIECVLAAFFPCGTTLEDLGKVDRAQFSAVVDHSREALVQLLVDVGAQLAAVGTAQHAAEAGKFASELKGGTLDDFYQGVTGLCGEPDADLEEGMRKEHTDRPDSHVKFSTPNYGILTDAFTEFNLAASGGSGCKKAPGGGEGVVVTGTRGCYKASGLKWVPHTSISRFRGELAAVHIDLKERTVAFTDSFATVRSAQRCPLGGKGYYELEILDHVDECPQYGFAAPTFERVLGSSDEGVGVGDDAKSWAVDGARQRKWHVLIDGVDKTNTARLSEAFGDLDLDSDGLLSLEEFTPLAKMLGAGEDNDVRELFDAFDSDSDGTICESDFLAFFRQEFGCDDLEGDLDDLTDEAQEGMQELLQSLCMLMEPYESKWHAGDIIGLACDLDAMRMHVSVNGSFTAPNGVVFELDSDAARDGLFAAFSGRSGKVRYNLGEAPFKHLPPAADYQVFVAFETTPPSSDHILENVGLAEALARQTEFTQHEWDAFDIRGLSMSHFVQAGDTYYRPAGTEEQYDVRVVRPLAYYGDFGTDGRLKLGVGNEVVVDEAFTIRGENLFGEQIQKEIAKGTQGRVLEFASRNDASRNLLLDRRGNHQGCDEGAAKIALRAPVSEELWVPKDQFYRLYSLPSELDTPIQRVVKLAKLRRCDVIALVLYTGPMFVLYNALLRGFGFCGAVEAGIEFGSNEFWAQWKTVDINAWLETSGHKYTNTIHALCSAIKKLQAIADDAPGTRLYRGLGGLSVREFLVSLGFADKAFLSTTKDRDIALAYSGVKEGGVGTVLCIETSTTNNGAVIVFFSQYPGEEETVWNACSFVQHLPGNQEVMLPEGGGVVRIYNVLVSANSRALTVEELEARRKQVVTQMLDTLHNDVCRSVEAEAATAEFKARLSQDRWGGYKEGYTSYKNDFICSILDESAARVAVYKTLPGSAYASVETLGEVVSQGLMLPVLSRAKLRLWLEEPSMTCLEMSNLNLFNFNAAQGRRLARRRLLLQDSAAGRRGSTDSVGRTVVEDGLGRMGGTVTAALAFEDCRERRLVAGADAAALERKDLISGETPLIAQVKLGERENVRRLLQAGADANAINADGDSALTIAFKELRYDIVELLAKMNIKVCDATGMTALHCASDWGQIDLVHRLLELGADVESTDHDCKTALDYAGCFENVEAALREHGGKHSLFHAAEKDMPELVAELIKEGADAALTDRGGKTALWLACDNGHESAAAELMEATKLAGALDLGCGSYKQSALHIASSKGLADTVSKLLSLGADAALTDADGCTALCLACRARHESAAAELMEATKLAGALDLQAERSKRSALHIASAKGLVGTVARLLSLGADAALTDKSGKTPLELAGNNSEEERERERVRLNRVANELRGVLVR